MSRAGYDIGTEIGEIMNHVFLSGFAKGIAMIGRIIGMILLCGCVLVALVDYGLGVADGKLVWPCILVGVCGVLFLVGMHWLALQIDKKHTEKE